MTVKWCSGVVAVVLLAVAVAACGSSSSTTTVAHHASHRKHHHTRFAGLGSPKRVFVHTNYQGPSNLPGAPKGLTWYRVDAVNGKGRVTAFHATENAKPPESDRDRLLLLAGEMLTPHKIPDAVKQTSTCIVWRVPGLRQRLGVDYAVTTTTDGTDQAAVHASRTPECPY
jgi:hypothetical protein